MQRMYSPTARSLLALATAALVLAGCGDDGVPDDVEPPRETAHAVPDLPRGWSAERNDAGGFAVGVPPGWVAKRRGTETRITSPDRLAVVTVKPDRSNEALEADLEELTDATGIAFGNQFSDYELGETKPFAHRYDAYSATARGSDKGIGQELEVFLVRRGELATFTVFAQRNERFGTDAYVPAIDRIVRSLRSRPVG